jgi:tetratricopeptide (TPR) repeat protein
MKTLLLSTLLLLPGGYALAQQSRYEQAMLQTLAITDTTERVSVQVAAAAKFQRIAQAEKTRWLPYYYAALCYVTAAFEAPKDQIDGLCDQAIANVMRADSLAPNNAEIYCLRSMIPIAQISVDFMKRGQENLDLSRSLLKKAYELDANNPRVYFLQGQHLFNTPPMFGGDRQKAKEYFQKALTLLDAHAATEKTIDIHWGRKSTVKMLASY